MVYLYPDSDRELGVIGTHSDHKDVLVVYWNGCDCRRWSTVIGIHGDLSLHPSKPRVASDRNGKFWLWLLPLR